MTQSFPTMRSGDWRISSAVTTLTCCYCKKTVEFKLVDIDDRRMYSILEGMERIEQECSPACRRSAMLDWLKFIAEGTVERERYGDPSIKADQKTWLADHCPPEERETYAALLAECRLGNP